jgi:hypothetical protein
LVLLVPSRAAEPIASIIGQRAPTAILRTMPSDTPPNQRLAGLVFIAGYEVIGQPFPLSAAQANRLDAAMKDPDACDTTQNEEHMRPGVAYRFGSGADAVDLLVCFSCDKIAAIPPGAGAITTTHHITQATRDVLLGLAKELLPQDEAIQELPRIRSEHPIPPPPAPVPRDAPR